MDKALARIDAQTSVSDVIAATGREAALLGVTAGTFHVAAPHASQVGPRVYVAEFGHDPEWIDAYRTAEFRQHDPFPDFVMRTGNVMTYVDVLRQISLTADQNAFVAQLKERGQFETIAIPVYGPFDFDTYATITMGRPFTPEDELLIYHVVGVVEASNRRIAHLLESSAAKQIDLSEREGQVLNWMGRSKSSGDIATILDIGPATVDTYVRRLYAKLDVNDRISAVLKGVRFGLIRF
jgi:DNA-binding CsgD family transcriptional regulator